MSTTTTTTTLHCTARAIGTCGEHCAPDETPHTHCANCWGAVLPGDTACLWCGAETPDGTTARQAAAIAREIGRCERAAQDADALRDHYLSRAIICESAATRADHVTGIDWADRAATARQHATRAADTASAHRADLHYWQTAQAALTA